jgi:hypothetical protein
MAPRAVREAAWARLAQDLDTAQLERMTREVGLADAIALHPGELLATALGLTPSPALARPPADPIPSPTVWCALDAADAVRHDALLECLQCHSALDPSLAVRRDPRSGQILIGGPGELHLEVLYDRLVRELRAPDLRRGPIRVERTRVLRFPVTVQAEVVDASAAARHLIVLTFAPGAVSSLGLPAALSLGQAQIGALEAGLAFSVDVSLGSEETSGPLAVTVDRLEGPGPAGETPPPVLHELAAKAAAAAVATGQWRYAEPWVQCLASVPWPAIGRFQGALARRGVRALTPLDSTHGCQNFQGRVPLRLLIGFPIEFLVLTAGFGCVALTPCAAPDPSQHDDDTSVTETA